MKSFADKGMTQVYLLIHSTKCGKLFELIRKKCGMAQLCICARQSISNLATLCLIAVDFQNQLQ